MPEGDIETYYEDGIWKTKIDGSSRAAHTFDAKYEAVAAGRQMARERKVEHLIRKEDGSIGERNSYGHDPRNIPG
jgi:hypothetical protein